MNNWIQHFPTLMALDDPAEKALLRAAQPLHWPCGQTVFHVGTPCSHYILVVEGHIRVQQTSSEGREIVLYRIGPGESCILTTACLFSHRPYPAMGITESKVHAITFPRHAFDQLVGHSALFRQFVFNAYGERLTDILTLIEEVVFTRLDIRLARKLMSLCANTSVIAITHQTLAVELGSAREVISRALKEFEQRGWLIRGLGQIEITNPHALYQLANPEY